MTELSPKTLLTLSLEKEGRQAWKELSCLIAKEALNYSINWI